MAASKYVPSQGNTDQYRPQSLLFNWPILALGTCKWKRKVLQALDLSYNGKQA